MSVPVGSIIAPPTLQRRTGGNPLEDFQRMLGMQRNHAVQDDALQRAQLTRGIVNEGLGIDQDADFAAFIGAEKSKAQTGLLNNQSNFTAERGRGLAQQTAVQSDAFNQLLARRAENEQANSLFAQGIADGNYDPGNQFLVDQASNPALQQFVGAQGRALFDQQQQAGVKSRIDETNFENMTALLGARTQKLGGVNNSLALQALQQQLPIKEDSANRLADAQLGRNITQGRHDTNNRDVLANEQFQRAVRRSGDQSEAFASMLGLQGLDPQMVRNLGSDGIGTAVQMQNQQTMALMDKLIASKAALRDEDGDLGDGGEAAERLINQQIQALSQSLQTGAGQTNPVVKQINDQINAKLAADEAKHQEILEKAKEQRFNFIDLLPFVPRSVPPTAR